MFVEHKEAVEVTEAPAKVLKFSEALRIGASLTPHCRNGAYITSVSGATCAWGAAAVGYGERSIEGVGKRAGDMHINMNELKRAFLSACGLSIVHANDRHGWSREEIADALEKIGY